MEILDLHHVSLNVSNVEEATDFYVNVLGMQVLPRPELGIDGTWLSMGGTRQVHLIDAEVPTKAGQHFAFQVADLDAAIAELKDKGVDISDVIDFGVGRQAFLFDPSGNQIELNQPAA